MSKTNSVCRVCGAVLNDENWSASRQKKHEYICVKCNCIQTRLWQKANPEKVRAIWTKANRKRGQLPMSENKECSMYLGVHVAERVLSQVFKDVKRMPITNPGYDFICNHGKKIDVKSSCFGKRGHWIFVIKHNTTADFFLCLAFDNRKDLTPLHVWLIPGDVVNHLGGASIRQGTLSKWDEYKLDISKVSTCCDTLRNQSATTTESPSFKSPAATHSEPPSR